MTIYTTTYPNPDADGTTCALAFAEFLRSMRRKAEAAIKGRLDDETSFILRLFGVERPRIVDSCDEADEIYLFDTHHAAQIGGLLDCAKVVEIIDHHPGGNPETFAAPTTTERDREAAVWLRDQADIPQDLPRLMFAARSAFGLRSTTSLLEGGCKVFSLGGHHVAMCQIEGVDVGRILNREDLSVALARLAAMHGTDLTLLTVVDVPERSTTIVPANEKTARVLARALQLSLDGTMVTVNRILLRKSDLVPALQAFFDKESD